MSTKKEKTKSNSDAKPNEKEWNVVWKDPNELTPYDKNARKNDETVPYLVNSIKRFGFRVPLVIDAKGVVVCGHAPKGCFEHGYGESPMHFCMTSRGVKKQDASMITSAIRGVFESNAQARAEFLALIK